MKVHKLGDFALSYNFSILKPDLNSGVRQILKRLPMSFVSTIDAATIQQWIAAKLEPAAVEKDLQLKGFDEKAIAAHLKEFRKARNAKKLSAGMVYMAIGAFLGFISTVLAIFNPVPELYNYILYGLTSVAILIIFWGLYLVFE